MYTANATGDSQCVRLYVDHGLFQSIKSYPAVEHTTVTFLFRLISPIKSSVMWSMALMSWISD